MKVLHLESNEKKFLEKDLNKTEATFAEEEKKISCRNGPSNGLLRNLMSLFF